MFALVLCRGAVRDELELLRSEQMSWKRSFPLLALALVVALVAWRWKADATPEALPVPVVSEAQPTANDVGALAKSSVEREPARESLATVSVVEAQSEPEVLVASTTDYRFHVKHPDGTPAIAIEVQFEVDGHTQRYLSDAAGTARIPRADFQSGWLMTARDGDCAASGDLTAKSFPGGLRDEHDLPLFPLVAVHGRVLSLQDEPIPQATVSIRSAGTRLFAGSFRPRTDITVDAESRFEALLESMGGLLSFSANASGFSRTTRQESIGVADGAEIVLRLGEGSSITGVVVDANRAAVDGATVWLRRYDANGTPIETALMRKFDTDESGSFHFKAAEGDGWALIAEFEGWCSSDPHFFALAPGETTFVTLQLVAPVAISGVVVHEDGTPVVGAGVGAVRDEAQRPELDRVKGSDLMSKYGLAMTETDANGRFELYPIRPGEAAYRVICVPDPKQRDRKTELAGVLPGATSVRIVLNEEELAGGVLEVRVHYADTGAPLSSSIWFLYELGPNGSWGMTGMRRFDAGVLRRDGLLPGVQYCGVVQPREAGYLAAFIEPFEARMGMQSFDISMPRAERIELVVPAGADGMRADRVSVRPIDPHPGDDSARSEAVGDDATVVVHLRPGRYAARAGEGAELEFVVVVTERGVSAPITLPADH